MKPDITIIGAGPAGLSAAISCAAEGLSTVVLENGRIGGQAFWSNAIENFAFAMKLDGKQIAKLGKIQASKFGAQFIASKAIGLTNGSNRLAIDTDKGILVSRAVVIACGLRMQSLGKIGPANPLHLKRYCRKNIAIVGGGNSAGQAADLLNECGANVTLFVRRAITMSEYLAKRLRRRVKIVVSDKLDTSRGKTHCIVNGQSFDNAFAFIGSKPELPLFPIVQRDSDGYVIANHRLETNVNGVFVAGDIRAGSIKRVASAVGDGAVVAPNVWDYLNTVKG